MEDDVAAGSRTITPNPAVADDGAGPTNPAAESVPVIGARPPGPSVKFALIVLGIALVIFLVGLVADLVSSSAPITPGPVAGSKVPGSPLRSIDATPLLGSAVSGNEPPGNILDALVVPAGTTRSSITVQGLGSYDDVIRFSTPATQGALITFFEHALPFLGWNVASKGVATRQPGSYEILAKKAGGDGYYWETGVIVRPTVFGSGTSTITPFSLELYQVTDSQ